MGNRVITETLLKEYLNYLRQEEKSNATIEKYQRDLYKLFVFAKDKQITKELMLEYKQSFMDKSKQASHYKTSSLNSFLAAANRFLDYMGWGDAKVKSCRVQKEIFRPENKNLSKEEYQNLLYTAQILGKKRLFHILETICSTGIRISELMYITVENVRLGWAQISCKGKVRKILFPPELQEKLLLYIEKLRITQGVVFRTRNGRPVDRSNLWKEMKKLCEYTAELEESVKNIKRQTKNKTGNKIIEENITDKTVQERKIQGEKIEKPCKQEQKQTDQKNINKKTQEKIRNYIEQLNGKEIERSCNLRNIREVKKSKVFPHNLRHLFANCFYNISKDIAKLADVLGHSSMETSRIYVQTNCEEHRKVLERMNLVL